MHVLMAGLRHQKGPLTSSVVLLYCCTVPQAKSTAAAKELLPWWKSVHDYALVQGVLLHGYGNWTAMCEVSETNALLC